MKLSTSALAFAFLSVGVKGNLQAQQSKSLRIHATTMKPHTIGVYGILGDVSSQDVSTVNERAPIACKEAETLGCFVTSWHPGNSETGHRSLQGCSSCDDDAFVEATRDIQHMFDVMMELPNIPSKGRSLQGCSSCDDDAFAVKEADTIEDTNVVNEKRAILTFLSSFCNGIQGRGVGNMYDCSFNVPATHTNTFPMSELSLLSFDRPSKALIAMEGLSSGDFSGGDLVILEQSALDAFNAAFSSYRVSFEVFAPSIFATEPITSDASEAEDTGLGIFIGQTAFLGIDEKLVHQWLSDDHAITQLKDLHSSFEKELCSKLKDSSSETFSNVRGCSFTVVHDPAM